MEAACEEKAAMDKRTQELHNKAHEQVSMVSLSHTIGVGWGALGDDIPKVGHLQIHCATIVCSYFELEVCKLATSCLIPIP